MRENLVHYYDLNWNVSKNRIIPIQFKVSLKKPYFK